MEQPLSAYAEFERSVAGMEAHVAMVVANLRAAYALRPDSANHRTEVQVGMLAELQHSDPRMLASLLVVAVDQLSRCSGVHHEPSVEDW